MTAERVLVVNAGSSSLKLSLLGPAGDRCLPHRLCGEIAAMAAAMNGLDALAFTGGTGEHSAAVRAAAAAGLAFLGVAIDEDANSGAQGDADISAPGSAVRTAVITAREDIEIARQARAVLAEHS